MWHSIMWVETREFHSHFITFTLLTFINCYHHQLAPLRCRFSPWAIVSGPQWHPSDSVGKLCCIIAWNMRKSTSFQDLESRLNWISFSFAANSKTFWKKWWNKLNWFSLVFLISISDFPGMCFASTRCATGKSDI